MRGLGAAVKGIFTAMQAMGIPVWIPAVLVAALVWFIGPKIVASIESDRPRRIVKRALLEQGEEKAKVADVALKMAGTDAGALVAIAEEAINQGNTALAEQTVARIRATGLRKKDVARLEQVLMGPMPSSSIEAILLVERLIEGGMNGVAQEKVTRFLRKWPTEPELLALQAQLAPPEAPVEQS